MNTLPLIGAILLLHEILPSGPWVFVAFIVLGLVFVTPLYVVRRRYGGTMLVVATTAEVMIAGVALAGPLAVLVPTVVGAAAAALILHRRALRRLDGHALLDIGLAIAGFWLALAVFAIATSVVLG